MSILALILASSVAPAPPPVGCLPLPRPEASRAHVIPVSTSKALNDGWLYRNPRASTCVVEREPAPVHKTSRPGPLLREPDRRTP